MLLGNQENIVHTKAWKQSKSEHSHAPDIIL